MMSLLKTSVVLLLLGKSICEEPYKVQFYIGENFEEGSLKGHLHFSRTIPAPSSCQTLPSICHNATSSVKTTECINLFSKEDCKGMQYKLKPGSYPHLSYFRDQAVSYRACDELSPKYPFREYRVKFYYFENFYKLAREELISEGCTNTQADGYCTVDVTFSSVETPICIKMYFDGDCGDDDGSYTVHGNVAALPDYIGIYRKIQSFKPCDPTAIKLARTNISRTSGKLSAKVVKFEINSDKLEVLRSTRTEYGVMGQKAIFRNDGPAVQTQKYTLEKTVTDRVEMEIVNGLSTMNEVNMADTISKDFTSGFRKSLNEGFRQSNSFGYSTSEKKGSKIGQGTSHYQEQSSSHHENYHAGASVGGFLASIIGGASAEANWENTKANKHGISSGMHSSSQSETSYQTHDEYTSEQNGYEMEEKNVEERIGQALTSGYRSSKSGSTSQGLKYSKEESKTYSIDQTISIPPCTEYELTSYVKRTKDFPVKYTVFVEVSGTKDDNINSPPLTASEIRAGLWDLEYLEDKDSHTVIAKGIGSLTLDFSWYSIWNGKGNPIEGCEDGTQMIKNDVAFVEFFGSPDYHGHLYKAKLTGNCQVLPERYRGKVVSVRTDKCVILFPSFNCDSVDSQQQTIGFTMKVNPGDGKRLFMYENVTVAFQSCDKYKSRNNDNRYVQFYGFSWKNIVPLLETRVDTTCTDIPKIAGNRISALDTNHCIKLYSEAECRGNSLIVRPHSALKLDLHFDLRTTSFTSCPKLEFEGKISNENKAHIKLFDDFRYNDLLLDAAVTPGCTTLSKFVWRKTSLVSTNVCVVLYSLPYCQGKSVVLKPGMELEFSFNNLLVSFSGCHVSQSGATTMIHELYQSMYIHLLMTCIAFIVKL